MPEHRLHYSITLDLPRAAVFEFFADAGNLGRITPPELQFTILSPQPIQMKTGALIEYRLKLYGLPFRWTAEITAWSPPDFFVDEQLEGPYRQWIHRHTLTDSPHGGTIIDDEVSFRLRAFPLGEVAYPIVRKQLERIFSYRQEAVKALLAGGN